MAFSILGIKRNADLVLAAVAKVGQEEFEKQFEARRLEDWEPLKGTRADDVNYARAALATNDALLRLKIAKEILS